MKTNFQGGPNIAMKVPAHQYDATVNFYANVLGLERLDEVTPCFRFGGVRLWIDRADGSGQAELWLEVTTDDVPAAAEHLQEAGVARCDIVEKLPDGFDGFWIANPTGVVHLVTSSD